MDHKTYEKQRKNNVSKSLGKCCDQESMSEDKQPGDKAEDFGMNMGKSKKKIRRK